MNEFIFNMYSNWLQVTSGRLGPELVDSIDMAHKIGERAIKPHNIS